MTEIGYAGCCGAKILFGWSMPLRSKKTFDEFMLKAAQQNKYTRCGIFSAIITQEQFDSGSPDAKKWLAEAGWKLDRKVSNPAHHHQTTLYLYSYITPEAREYPINEN